MSCPYWAVPFHRFLRGRKLAKSAGGGITEKSRGRDASPRLPCPPCYFGAAKRVDVSARRRAFLAAARVAPGGLGPHASDNGRSGAHSWPECLRVWVRDCMQRAGVCWKTQTWRVSESLLGPHASDAWHGRARSWTKCLKGWVRAGTQRGSVCWKTRTRQRGCAADAHWHTARGEAATNNSAFRIPNSTLNSSFLIYSPRRLPCSISSSPSSPARCSRPSCA